MFIYFILYKMPDKVRKFIYEMQYNFVILQHQKRH